jgi:hypothetical protein
LKLIPVRAPTPLSKTAEERRIQNLVILSEAKNLSEDFSHAHSEERFFAQNDK